MTTAVFADVEGAVRTWLRTVPVVTALVSTRVWFAVPEDSPTYPLVALSRVGGSPQGPETPVDDARLQFDCFGRTKAEAAAVAYAVCGAVHTLRAGTALDSTAVALSGQVVLGPLFSPDPDDNSPRYIVDAVITIRAT